MNCSVKICALCAWVVAGQPVHAMTIGVRTLLHAHAVAQQVEEQVPQVYLVKFDDNGGNGGTNIAQKCGTIIIAPTVKRDGYTFIGWSPEVDVTVPASNVTYTAQWLVNQYCVMLDANGGNGEMLPTNLMYGAEYALPYNLFAKPGFTLVGWSSTPDGNVEYGDGEMVSNMTALANGVIRLYAKWTANQYTVVFDANGGQGGTSGAQYFGSVIIPPIVEREGHTFAGWSPEVNATVPASNVTYVAQWIVKDGGTSDSGSGGVPGGNSGDGGGAQGGSDEGNPIIVIPETAGELKADFAKAQSPQGALVDASGNVAGSAQVKVGKVNKKGQVKITATATLMNGKKVSSKALTLNVGGGERSGKLEFKGIGTMEFEIAEDGTFTLKNGSYAMAGVSMGGNLPNGQMTFRVDMESLPKVDAGYEILTDLLPDGIALKVSGGKKLDAGKAASPKYKKGKATGEYALTGLDDPKKPNLSGLKLSYTPKTGLFKGSFSVYATNAGSTPANKAPKLKKYKVDVTGFFVNDGSGLVGEGEATMKKPASGPWKVVVE